MDDEELLSTRRERDRAERHEREAWQAEAREAAAQAEVMRLVRERDEARAEAERGIAVLVADIATQRAALEAVTARAEEAEAEATRLRDALQALTDSRCDEGRWCRDCGARWETQHPEGCGIGRALDALRSDRVTKPEGAR